MLIYAAQLTDTYYQTLLQSCLVFPARSCAICKVGSDLMSLAEMPTQVWTQTLSALRNSL